MFFFNIFQSAYFRSLPYLIMGVACVVGAVTALFLPETAGADLPDTIEDAEKFGKDLPFFYMPILGKERYNRPDAALRSRRKNNKGEDPEFDSAMNNMQTQI